MRNWNSVEKKKRGKNVIKYNKFITRPSLLSECFSVLCGYPSALSPGGGTALPPVSLGHALLLSLAAFCL